MFETFNLQPFEDDIRSSLEQAGREKIIRRLWKKDFTLWKEEDREISNRLGWLEAPEQAGPNQALWEELADTIRRGGITDVPLSDVAFDGTILKFGFQSPTPPDGLERAVSVELKIIDDKTMEGTLVVPDLNIATTVKATKQ